MDWILVFKIFSIIVITINVLTSIENENYIRGIFWVLVFDIIINQ